MLTPLAASRPTLEMYEDNSFLRNSNLRSFLYDILRSLDEYDFFLESSITSGIEVTWKNAHEYNSIKGTATYSNVRYPCMCELHSLQNLKLNLVFTEKVIVASFGCIAKWTFAWSLCRPETLQSSFLPNFLIFSAASTPTVNAVYFRSLICLSFRTLAELGNYPTLDHNSQGQILPLRDGYFLLQ